MKFYTIILYTVKQLISLICYNNDTTKKLSLFACKKRIKTF